LSELDPTQTIITLAGDITWRVPDHAPPDSVAEAVMAGSEDLKKITVPVLVMHGDDDQIVPFADSGPLSAKLAQNGTLKTYQGFPHGMPTTEAATINADLLAFIQS
jgi:pimeloyl-ACP methyl ester carboxylesterase